MRLRIKQELDLLREHYPDVVHAELNGEDWFLLPTYPFPPGWAFNSADVRVAGVVFKVGAGHPTSEPYGFAVPSGLTFNGAAPNNTGAFSAPFPGAWTLFSWAPEGTWRPAAEARGGSNLYDWARSFSQRLAEGR